MLEFEIQDQIMTRVDDSVVIARSEALKAHFGFKTDQWQPPYFAVFQGMKTDPYTVCLDWENNCIVPWEAIRYSGAMEVSLYSIPAYPTNRVKVKILDTGFDGCFPLPSPNIYDQLLFNKADEIDVKDGDVLLRAFGKEISRAKLPTGAGGGGEPGKAATIQVGQVTTGEPGSEAQVTNSGSESAAVFDFVIPRREPGAAGPQGERGEQGPAGQGIPDGGSAGQIPSKVDGSDYNLHWITPPGVYIESYVGNDESERTINLKVTPKCVFVFGENTALTMNDMTTPSINLCYSGAAAQGKGSLGLSLDGNMLKVNNDPDLSMAQTRRKLNSFGVNYIVLAWN